jgi:hypothetical protein
MYFENVAVRFVQPGEDDELLTFLDPVETSVYRRHDLDRGVGRSLVPLAWRIRPVDEL